MFNPNDIAALPPELQQKLRAELLKFLASIGVEPRIHRETGELLVPLDKMCAALGVPEDEARKIIAAEEGCVFQGSPDDLEALN